MPATTSPAPTPTAGPTGTTSPDAAALRRRKIGRLLIVGFRGTTLAPPATPIRTAIEAGELGGVILFDRDHLTTRPAGTSASPAQLGTLTDALHAAAIKGPLAGDVLIAVDQEGGKVARLNPANGYPATESEAALGAQTTLAIPPTPRRSWRSPWSGRAST